MFTVMHSGKTSEIEKCSPGVHVRRELKKSRFFSNRGRFRKISICSGENTLKDQDRTLPAMRFFFAKKNRISDISISELRRIYTIN